MGLSFWLYAASTIINNMPNMKKIIIILSFVILFSNLVSAGLYPVSVADLIQPNCNNNGICDYFENSARCPNECQTQNINTANKIVTSTTTIPL